MFKTLSREWWCFLIGCLLYLSAVADSLKGHSQTVVVWAIVILVALFIYDNQTCLSNPALFKVYRNFYWWSAIFVSLVAIPSVSKISPEKLNGLLAGVIALFLLGAAHDIVFKKNKEKI